MTDSDAATAERAPTAYYLIPGARTRPIPCPYDYCCVFLPVGCCGWPILRWPEDLRPLWRRFRVDRAGGDGADPAPKNILIVRGTG